MLTKLSQTENLLQWLSNDHPDNQKNFRNIILEKKVRMIPNNVDLPTAINKFKEAHY